MRTRGDRDLPSALLRADGRLEPTPGEIERIVSILEPYDFERVYGAWYGRIVHDDAKRAIARSAKRYVKAVIGS